MNTKTQDTLDAIVEPAVTDTPDAIESASSSPALDLTSEIIAEAAPEAETLDISIDPNTGLPWCLVFESTREDRAENIATAFLGVHAEREALSEEEKAQKTHVVAATLRTVIRKLLALPTLEGEALFGDLRAHSDAACGHGLKLETEFLVVEGKRSRSILLSAVNADICREFLARPAGFKFKSKRSGIIPECVFIPAATEASE